MLEYTIKLTTDEDEIKAVLENEYEDLAYDDSPSLKNFDTSDGVWFILKHNDETAGFITLKQLNNVMWSPHILIFKKYRGEFSEQWGIQVAKYMKDLFKVKKFLAFTPYKSAKYYAEKVGFKHIATLEKSIKKNNRLLDQYVLEMS